MRVMFGGSGASGGGTEPRLAIDSCVVGAVAGALDCANADPPHVAAATKIATATESEVRVMAAQYTLILSRIR
jgi:hypothetical protein